MKTDFSATGCELTMVNQEVALFVDSDPAALQPVQANLVSALGSVLGAVDPTKGGSSSLGDGITNSVDSILGTMSFELTKNEPPSVITTPGLALAVQGLDADSFAGSFKTEVQGTDLVFPPSFSDLLGDGAGQLQLASYGNSPFVSPSSTTTGSSILDVSIGQGGANVPVSDLLEPVVFNFTIDIPAGWEPNATQDEIVANTTEPKDESDPYECFGEVLYHPDYTDVLNINCAYWNGTDWSCKGLTFVERVGNVVTCKTVHFSKFSISFKISAPRVSLKNFDIRNSYLIYRCVSLPRARGGGRGGGA